MSFTQNHVPVEPKLPTNSPRHLHFKGQVQVIGFNIADPEDGLREGYIYGLAYVTPKGLGLIWKYCFHDYDKILAYQEKVNRQQWLDLSNWKVYPDCFAENFFTDRTISKEAAELLYQQGRIR